jgi:hypothetical protein
MTELVVLVLVHEDGMSNSYGIKRSDIPDLALFETEVRKQQHERSFSGEEGTLLDVLARKAVVKTECGQSILHAPEGYSFAPVVYTAWTWS